MIRKSAICLLALTATALAEIPAQIPVDWWLTDHSKDYTATVDRSVATSGSASVLLASKSPTASSFGGLIQATDAANYRGKRVRYSADLRTRVTQGWAGLWFRADKADGQVVAFDNMQDSERRVQGDTEWHRYSIVIDVPADAANMFYGITLGGSGKVWADALRIEVLDSAAPMVARRVGWGINPPPSHAPPAAPRNLDFEQ